MDLTKEINQHLVKRKVTDVHDEQSIAAEANLPDYFPEITRVLKCTLEPKIYAFKNLTEKVLVEGAAEYRVFYLGEENHLRSYTQTIPFQKTMECTLPAEAFLHAESKTEYVNCRVLLPRKLEIRGAVSIRLLAETLEEQQILSDCTGCGTEIQKETHSISDLIAYTCVLYPLSETLELSETKPDILELLRTDADAELQSYKLISGKILLKGNLLLKVTYITSQNPQTVESMTYTVPFSQILELAGAKEKAFANCRLKISALDVYPKEDGSGNVRLLDLKVVMGADISVYEEKECTVLLDAYSTQYDLKIQNQTVAMLRAKDTIKDTYLLKTKFPLHQPIAKVLSARYGHFTFTDEIKENVLHIHGELPLELVLQTPEGEVECLEHKAKVEYEHAVPMGENVAIDVSFVPCGMEYVLNASEHLDLRVEFSMEAFLFAQQLKTVLSSVALSEQKTETEKYAPLTLYFANAQETLWNIARHYNTTVLKIQQENNLQTDILEQKCTLFIPRA